MTMIPLDAIAPEAQSLRWRRSFEHHLDLIPPVLEAIVTMTVPHIQADRLRPKITGGGFADNMTAFLRGVDLDSEGRVTDVGANRDARDLWGFLVEYTRAVTSWLNADVPVPYAPTLPPLTEWQWTRGRPNPDPLLARGEALTLIGWLIGHADQIETFTRLDEYREFLFSEVRRYRGRYGVFDQSRRPRARCTVCGTLSVTITYVDGLNGSPKPVRAGKCTNCGQEYRDLPEPVVEAHTAPREVLSEVCADLMHEACKSIHCNCSCHELEGSPS